VLQDDIHNVARETMNYDVVVVGAGPAGLAAAIKLKQIDSSFSVVVVEKGSEIGAHILSGAVIDPIGLDTLLPEWRKDPQCPPMTAVTEDAFCFLTATKRFRIPNIIIPPLMNNHGNVIGSLALLTRYMAAKAEELGVEIYPGFAAAELLFNPTGAVIGVITGDMGVSREGTPTGRFTRGIELRGRYTLLCEGARGSLAKKAIERFDLSKGREPQKYGLGLKEIWEVKPEKFRPGYVQHTFGWPLDDRTGGGSFLYHFGDRHIAVGFVVHLNYENPTLSPFDEFQRSKSHPAIRNILEGGKRLAYGARAITEGGWQSVPKLSFPGGALVGCAAGFVNVPRIKGSHNAVLSGIVAAGKVAEALHEGRSHDEIIDIEASWRSSPIGHDLFRVRNVKPLWTRFGTIRGILLSGIDMWSNQLFRWSPFGTLKHGKPDHATLLPLAAVKPIVYPKPDGKISFDKLSSIFLSSTNHEEDQPSHLKLADPSVPIGTNLPVYGEPARLYCPAGVYEVVADGPAGETRFVINAQNCLHCKTCDIKDPTQNITWTVPEGGGGPNYSDM
jgi:electron-transferring-flavoprotein dehydrogenase